MTDIVANDEAGLGEGDETEAIDVDTDAEELRVLGCFVEVVTTPVMIPRVDEGALSGYEEPEADSEEELDDVPEADAEEELDNVPGADAEEELDNVPEADVEKELDDVPEADAEEELDNVPGADAEEELDNVPGADVEKELDNVPEADAEEVMGPRWTEMIEKVGLAFPESPITGEVY